MSIDLDDVPIPDSQVAREAQELCAEMRPPMLINHSYRSYFWATALAAYEGLSYDEEVLYVTSLLHDYGLSEHVDAAAPSCFTLLGARKCLSLNGTWTKERAERAAQAVTLHMNLRVRPKDGPEAYLTMAGTQLDVIGSRCWSIAPETSRAILDRFPRGEVKNGMVELFRRQARTHRGTRADFYWRYLALGLLIRTAPFDQ